MNSKVLVLSKRPDESFPQQIDIFSVQSRPTQQLQPGQILIRVLYIGVDPVMRVWLSGAKTYIDSVQIGQVMPAFGVGQCVESNSKNWAPGISLSSIFRTTRFWSFGMCSILCETNLQTVQGAFLCINWGSHHSTHSIHVNLNSNLVME